MPFSFVEIGPDRFLPVSDEYTEDVYAQVLGLSDVPSISRYEDVVAVFGIYSINTCKTERTSFAVQVIHCYGDGSGNTQGSLRTLEFDPDVLSHFESVASNLMPAFEVNNRPNLFAVEINQRNNAWLAVGPGNPEHNHFRIALLGIYVPVIGQV